MGFLAPWFLAGAVAVGVPLYLHLLRRHTTNPQQFSSLMFFEQRTQSSVRHRRLRYLLLLSLRLALLVLLALAFAGPYINEPAASTPGGKLLLLAIDESFSMRAGTRLSDAKREALSVLAGRSVGERGQILAFGSEVDARTQPVDDAGTLRAAIESIQPGDSLGSFGELAHAVRSISDNIRAPIELHVFSDMQKAGMPASFSELALPADVTLILHPVVKDTAPNWTVESVNTPGQVFDPKKARVQAVVAGYGTPAAMRTVSLVVNGKTVASRTVEVPASGRASVEFQSLDVPYGFSRCAVKIDSADSFPADDTYLFASGRFDPERVLLVHESTDTRSAVYFSDALSAAAESAFNVESLTVERAAGVPLSPYAFVVLSDVASLPSSFENDLLRYVRSGGGVLIAAGTSTARRGRVPVFGENILQPRYYSSDPARFMAVADSDSSYPPAGKIEQWDGVRFYYAASVDPSNSRVVARLTDQTPLLLDKKIGEGRALLFASGLDNVTNDFPLHPAFVPFAEQTARYLSGTERRGGSRMVDSFLELRTAKEQAVSVEVVDPAGRRPLSLKEATSAQSYKLTQAGFYELHLANGRQDLIGVNPDRRESDLAVIPPDVLALWKGGRSPGSQEATAPAQPGARPLMKPRSLSWYAMLLVLAAAVAESVLASRYLGMQRQEE